MSAPKRNGTGIDTKFVLKTRGVDFVTERQSSLRRGVENFEPKRKLCMRINSVPLSLLRLSSFHYFFSFMRLVYITRSEQFLFFTSAYISVQLHQLQNLGDGMFQTRFLLGSLLRALAGGQMLIHKYVNGQDIQELRSGRLSCHLSI